MTRDQALLAAAAIAVVAAAVCLSPWSPLVKKTAPEGHEGTTWSPYKPVAHRARGGLFHPPVCGQGRTGLILYGWDWIANPPSELAGPGLVTEQP